MLAKGLFMFKNLQERKAGEFKNEQTGELVKYDDCNVIVADEIQDDGKIVERRLKFPKENTNLVQELSILDAYTRIEITFDVALYSANAKLTPVSYRVVE